jgi:membrane protein DedA with SNARE-associated domain
VLICTLSGYFFGGLDWVQNHFESVIVAIVLISVTPMAVEFGLGWWRKRNGHVEPPPKHVDHLLAKPVQPEVAPR